MNYLVSFENQPEYQWQMELLLESFKIHNLSQDLLVVATKSNLPSNPFFCRNLSRHKRAIGFDNIGDLRGYSKLNRYYNLMWTQMAELISQPIVFIDTDVVLKNPVSYIFDPYPQFIFSPDLDFSFDSVISNVGNFWEWLDKDKEVFSKNWLPLGGVCVFSNIPSALFPLIIERIEFFAIKQLMEKKQIWEHTDKLGLVSVMLENLQKINCRGDYSLSAPIFGSEANFISYEKGIPPTFHKFMFKFSEEMFLSFGDPIEILSKTFPSPNASYLASIAETCLKNRHM
ncbi:MAG: hypothetical protein EKK64_06970 [Neisseriaceae bacterium]|nr:MAG: hypothetical protein EKK64_06970 [Neisseriaceae bacterium]